MIYVGLLNIPQAYVDSVYVLGFIRFLQGFGLGGMLPALNTYLASKHLRNIRDKYSRTISLVCLWVTF